MCDCERHGDDVFEQRGGVQSQCHRQQTHPLGEFKWMRLSDDVRMIDYIPSITALNEALGRITFAQMASLGLKYPCKSTD